MDFVDVCPPAVVARVQAEDLSAEGAQGLFSWIGDTATAACRLKALVAIAARMDADSHPGVVRAFASAVTSNARFLPPDALEPLAGAFRRVRIDAEGAAGYFGALRATGIDLRDHLRGRVPEDWSFADPYSGATTWHYHLYLASLQEPGALDALADKIARTESGNAVSLLLQSLDQLGGAEVTEVLRRYLGDERREEGMTGPGSTVGATVEVLLQIRALRG